jgi:hypothetical protein
MELDLEVCELRKLKKRWMDDINAFSDLPNKRSKDNQSVSSGMKIMHASLIPIKICIFSNVAFINIEFNTSDRINATVDF